MKLLLAVDDSKFSEAATDAVVAQYPSKETDVQVLNVVDLAIPIPTSYADGFRQESLKHGQELVQRTRKKLSDAGFKVETTVEEGDPKSKILDRAANWHADLIVMGSHGRKGIEHFLMGSVSEAVVRYAPCSVEVVRAHSAAA
jgi:nucleotide-binding universal stress UspA family protein